jgi:hypothetical protein
LKKEPVTVETDELPDGMLIPKSRTLKRRPGALKLPGCYTTVILPQVNMKEFATR